MAQETLFAVEPAAPIDDGIARAAELSRCGRYRYLLARRWAYPPALQSRLVVFVMLNPSTADASADDPTIRRCMSFARREGCHALEVVNLYALRSPDPERLAAEADPIGPDADDWLHSAATRASVIIVAWGASGPKGWQKRAIDVLALLRQHGDVYCLGKTLDGTPRHPLYLKAAAPLVLLATGPSREPIPLSAPDGRDGLAFVAFPLGLDDVPHEVAERVDAARWWMDNDGAPFGRGATPEEAIADLRTHAARIKGGCASAE